MNAFDQLKAQFPRYQTCDLERWLEGGRRYASQFDKLPSIERECVAFFFASFGLTKSTESKKSFMRCIDVIMRPWYPMAGAA